MSDLLKTLRTDLKHLLANSRQGELFRRLREDVLGEGSDLYNDAVLLESNWNENQRRDMLGTVTFEHANVSFASLGEALTWLIDRIEIGDLSELYRQKADSHVMIAPHAIHAVDRFEQREEFELLDFDLPDELRQFHNGKVRFFYLHGDIRQMHKDLVDHLGHRQARAWKDFSQGGFDPERRPVIVTHKSQPCRSPKLFPVQIMRDLMGKFDISPQPTQTKRLSDLLQSKLLAGKGEDDVVFILLTLDDYNWNSEGTPALVRLLYKDFCDCELPADAPSFFFFFGIEYQKDNLAIQQEVAAAVDQAQYGIALPRLNPVPLRDVEEWFSQIRYALKPGADPRQLARQLFPDQDSIDMADIMIALQQFIHTHNDGLLFNDE